MKDDPFSKLIGAIKELGEGAKRLQEEGVRTRIKVDGTSVTQVDKEIEAKISSLIGGLFPEDSILGEEGGLTERTGGARVWVIDPIDGTTNYRFGLPIWAISVGLLEDGVPLWGCVYLPVLDKLFLAGRGEGSTCNGKPIRPLSRSHLHKEDILGITSEGAKDWDFEVPQKIRALGSAAAQACFVAAGNYVGYFVERWHIWDLAAGLLIAREAGVKVVDRCGEELERFPNMGAEEGPPILFSSPGVYRELLHLIRPKPHWRGKPCLSLVK